MPWSWCLTSAVDYSVTWGRSLFLSLLRARHSPTQQTVHTVNLHFLDSWQLGISKSVLLLALLRSIGIYRCACNSSTIGWAFVSGKHVHRSHHVIKSMSAHAEWVAVSVEFIRGAAFVLHQRRRLWHLFEGTVYSKKCGRHWTTYTAWVLALEFQTHSCSQNHTNSKASRHNAVHATSFYHSACAKCKYQLKTWRMKRVWDGTDIGSCMLW